MLTVQDAEELRRRVEAWRAGGETVGFVPTMGALHAGHLALVARARALAPRVVASIFVNPSQFGPGEDFESYPRMPERDAELLAGACCDLLFLPTVETVYPPGHATWVEVGRPAVGLEGDHRPGHFRGVTTVVTQLFGLVRPDVAAFGEKDAQQLAVVRRLTADLHLAVRIVGVPTVREADGLALSSRNAYLDPSEREAATVLFRSLATARDAIDAGERDAGQIRRLLRDVLAGEPRAQVEYAEAVDAETFQPVREIRGRIVLPLAVRIGRTRLIDNFQLAVEG